MGYSKRITKTQRKAIKNARKQNNTLKEGATAKQLASVRRYGK